MNLYLRDLGTDRYLVLLRRRLNPVLTTTSGQPLTAQAPMPAPRPKNAKSRLMRFWLKEFKLEGDLYAKTAEVVGASPSFSSGAGLAIFFSLFFLLPGIIMLFLSAPAFLTFFFLMMWAVMMLCTVYSPRSLLRQTLQKPLTAGEIEALLPSARGKLERAYLTLVLDALSHQSTMSASAQSDVRAALAALGETISKLPAGPVPTADPAILRQEAEAFRLEAGRENDAFIRSSFLRQAESLEKRADLGAENATSSRRISALRREARTQMDALRALLAAFSQTAPGEAAQNVALAEAVSRVSGEAQAITRAHRELADAEIAALLGHPMPATIPVQPTPAAAPTQASSWTPTQTGQQAAGGGQNPPQVQQVGNGRPWWRG